MSYDPEQLQNYNLYTYSKLENLFHDVAFIKSHNTKLKGFEE